jgi:ATP-dependent protease HslVU (ClpYQ) peptidase subunit
MTCIVGYIKNKKVYIGGDSAGVAGLHITPRKDAKVFRNGKFIMGYTSSFRMGQLLRFKLSVPSQPEEISDYEYMCTLFIDAVRKCLKDGAFATIKDSAERIGVFLVGYKRRLYKLEGDLQVGVSYYNFESVGCGSDYAKGALSLLEATNLSAETIIKKALETAVKFSGGVRPPFVIMKG